jgi:hypothetical protein
MSDPVVNFGKVTVSTGYDDTETSIDLMSGHGARIPDPSTDGAFNLVWWNVTDYADPSDDPNKEIVRVTSRTTDNITVTRAEEGTTGSTKNTGGKTYQMILAFTKKAYEEKAANCDIQIFDAGADTWTKPVGAKRVDVVVIGGGGGGGSGFKYDGNEQGGAGGGGGGISKQSFDASVLGATESVYAAVPVAGGASVTTDATDGNPGADGEQSFFGDYLRGEGGKGGYVDADTGYGGLGGWGLFSHGTNGADSQYEDVGLPGQPTGVDVMLAPDKLGYLWGATGGGSGGGSNTESDGGEGGEFDPELSPFISTREGGVPGTVGAGQDGGDGEGIDGEEIGGTGGGGGAGADTGTIAGEGGKGGGYGGGGAGGGAGRDAGPDSGPGGDGGKGLVKVTTYF